MPFDVSRGRTLDPAPGSVLISPAELPPLPDAILTDPEAGRLDPRRWFPDPERPFELEIGCGKGTFLAQQAQLQPEINFLGIEWAKEYAVYAADRVRRHRERGRLANVRVLYADATEFLRWRCPAELCRVIHLYFSDPWPKTKHHKNRVVQHRFLFECWRVLVSGGELRVVTDHDELWAWDEAHFDGWVRGGGLDRLPADVRALAEGGGVPDPAFSRVGFDRPASAGAGELVGTNFERKFRREGRGFHATVLRKIGSQGACVRGESGHARC